MQIPSKVYTGVNTHMQRESAREREGGKEGAGENKNHPRPHV